MEDRKMDLDHRGHHRHGAPTALHRLYLGQCVEHIGRHNHENGNAAHG